METDLFAFSVFTFDSASGELKRRGSCLRMPPQTTLLLTILLERAGTVVTREELRQRLWPDGQFLDHEHAINRAVNYLRMVLRDSSKNPQFIETLPKRGYRFVAEVTRVPVANPSLQTVPEVPAQKVEISAPSFSNSQMLVPVEVIDPGEPATLLARTLFRSFHRVTQRQRLLAGFAVLAVCTVLLTGVILILTKPKKVSAQPATVSMGIVPFDTPDNRSAQLGESFRMDLTDTLSQLPSVQLRASHSLSSMKENNASLREIARTLHLDALLLGKFSIDGDRCILQLELVRGQDAVHIASFRYAGALSELAMIRDKVQRDVFASLQPSVNSIQAEAGSTQDPLAYSAYLQARDLASRRTVASLNSALAHYIGAAERDSNFARAYAGMASAYMSLGSLTDPVEHLREAQLFARKALQLDPRLAEAHAVLGFVAMRQDWNTSVGENELRLAVELEPNEATYHAWLAELLADEGHFENALHEVDIAHTDDPVWPQIDAIEVFVAGAARQNVRAVDTARRYVSLQPNSSFAHDQLGWILFDAGHYVDAIHEWRTMATMEKDPTRIDLEDRGLAAYRRRGVAAYAALKLDAIASHSDAVSSHPNDFIPEEWYAYVGDRDHAIAALEQTIDRHDPSAIDIAVNPMFDNLHDDPRFQALLNRVGVELPDSAHLLHASLHP